MPENPKDILFLDKVLTKPLKERRLRGVEVFNVFFIRDLLELGHRVTLIIHPTWIELLEEEIPASSNLTIEVASRLGGKNLGSLFALRRIQKQQFDVLFLANVGNGILVPYHYIQRKGMAAKTVLLAHKVPGDKFVKFLKDDTSVVSVNRTISRPFENAAKFPVTDVYYGILNDTKFFPPDSPSKGDTVRFGMLGDLDSDWKGSDTAIAAFQKLPPEIAERAELHLAAFTRNPPEVDDPRIKVHQWIERDQVGDYLRGLDIMLTLSREIDGEMMETFCQTMVQGMLCGLPQVTTSLEIFTEKLDEGGGLSTTDEESLLEAMVRLATDEDFRDEQSDIAHRVARKRYVWNSEYFVEKYF